MIKSALIPAGIAGGRWRQFTGAYIVTVTRQFVSVRHTLNTSMTFIDVNLVERQRT